MKSLNIISVILFCLYVGFPNLTAQNTTTVQNILQDLTEEQQQILQSQRNLIVENRENFKATLTAEQLLILSNKELSKQQKEDALIKTFTKEQKKLLAENKERVEAIKNEFKKTITEDQMQQIRAQVKGNKASDNGGEIRESVKEARKQNQRGN